MSYSIYVWNMEIFLFESFLCRGQLTIQTAVHNSLFSTGSEYFLIQIVHNVQ